MSERERMASLKEYLARLHKQRQRRQGLAQIGWAILSTIGVGMVFVMVATMLDKASF